MFRTAGRGQLGGKGSRSCYSCYSRRCSHRFVITYISTEHGLEHTPDYRLAFGVEAAWVLGLLVIGGLVVLIQKSRNQK